MPTARRGHGTRDGSFDGLFVPSPRYRLATATGSAPGGALSVRRNASTASWSAPDSFLYASVTCLPSPLCRRIAAFSVAAAPSCMYGAESATPHKGGVFHSLGFASSAGNGTSGSGAYGSPAVLFGSSRVCSRKSL